MAPFDAAFGAGQNTVNVLLPQLFKALTSAGLFNFDVGIDQVGFKSVHIEMTQSPTVDFTPDGIPSHVLKTVTKGVANSPDLQDLDEAAKNALISGALATLSTINFDIIVTGINLSLTYTDATKPALDLTAKIVLTTLVSIDATSAPSIKFQAESGVITTSKPDLDSILNSAIVPYVRTKINSDILTPITVPVLEFAGVQVSVPVVQIVNDYLLAYTSLGVSPPDLPAGAAGWPDNGVFIAVTPSLIGGLANKALADAVGSLPHTGFNEGPFTGDLGISVGQLQNIDVEGDGSLTATIDARAAANITFHTPWPLPNFSFGPVASGLVGISAKASVTNRQVSISRLSITKFDLSMNWGGIPGWISAVLQPLLGPLQDYLFDKLVKPQLNELLGGLVVPVYTIPTITVPVKDGHNLTISLENIDTGRLTVGDRNLLVAYGTPVIG